MPLRESLGGVEAGIAAFEAYAELGPIDRGRALAGDLVLREPRGVVAILMPWCDPLAASCGALAAALVTGNTVVLKPSEKAPLAAERMVELLELGGVLQLLHGDERAARPLATHPAVDLVIRPGEEAAGSAPGDRRRGHRPGLGGARGRGQRVRRRRPVLRVGRARARAPRRSRSASSRRSSRRARTLKVGPGMDADTELGPVIDADHRLWVHRQVQDAVYAGAELLAGGTPLPRAGFFYPPTVIAGAPDDALVHLRRDARPGRRPSARCRPSRRR